MSKVRKGLLAELGAQSALEELRVRIELSPHWHAAWSNEAFELWYLFHFQENIGGGISRDRVKEMLSGHLGVRYEKNDSRMFEILLPRVGVAIGRANRAFLRWSTETPYHARNPATAVYQLVGDLLLYL